MQEWIWRWDLWQVQCIWFSVYKFCVKLVEGWLGKMCQIQWSNHGRRNPSEVPFRTYFKHRRYFKHKGEGLFLFSCLLNGMFSVCGFCWLVDGFCFFLFLVLLIKFHHGTD